MELHGALPLYLRISEGLIRDIAAGRLADGARLPPEREMAATLGVAVGTLRAALADLAAKGMLVRVQGSGNYVRAVADPASVYAMFRLELLGGGGLPRARVLSLDRVAQDPALPRLGESAVAHRIRRLRFLSGTVAAVEEIWLDGSLDLPSDPGSLSESLYLHLRQRLGLSILRAEDRIGQGPLPPWSPPEFPHPPGTPLPLVSRTGWADDRGPVEASLTWFDPGTVRYTVRLR